MLQDLIDKSLKKLENFDPEVLVKELAINGFLPIDVGARDIRDKEGTGNYCWFPGFIDLLKPKQVVELGGAMGVGDISILSSSYKDFQLWSITLEEHGLEFAYVEKGKYPNFHSVIGDDLDLNNWPTELDLSKTDLWFIDSLHTEAQLRKELELYKPFFKKGAIILFDDIFLPELESVWQDLENIIPVAYKTALPLHYTGWGLVQIGDK